MFHVKQSDLRRFEQVTGFALPEEATAALDAFESLLRRYAVPAGFVAAGDAPVLAERHLLDSLRAAPILPPGTAADLGSGAGLPGIVVAIARPDLIVTMIEPQRRRLAFLELAVDELRLPNAVPVGARAEDVRLSFDAALARAFADAGASWRAAARLLAPAGRLVYFAGESFAAADLPAHVRAELVPPSPLLASSGPLVIMTRQ